MTMSKAKIEEIYPEEYLVEEDEMSENSAQFQLILYLVQILAYYYRVENWFVVGDLMLIHPKIQNSRHSISPDVLVFKGIAISQEERKYMASWRIEENHPAPPVVFEISSDATWKNDIERGEQQKPAIYGRIGVKEYYAYDPFHERVWQGEPRRLLGWRYEESSKPIAIIPDERGWLWSEELDSWLGADGEYLRLYDRAGNLRLTNTEAAEARILELEAQLRRAQGKN